MSLQSTEPRANGKLQTQWVTVATYKTVWLHTAIMLAGKTEATLDKKKFPDIEMELVWMPGLALRIKSKGVSKLLPDTAIKDSVLEGEPGKAH